MKHRAPWKPLAVLFFAALLAACATTGPKRHEELMAAVQAYNEAIRWDRPDRATPWVAASQATAFRDWSEDAVERYDYQDWEVREMRYDSETTAQVEVQRKGFEVPRYVEETWRIDQTWSLVPGQGWRLLEGF